jgi:hypothetical protein
VLAEISSHIQEDILGNNELKGLVRDLWKAHPRACRLIYEHRPCLRDIRAKYKELLQAKLGKSAKFEEYPTRGEPYEIKLWLEDWWDRGFPFVFMFYKSQEDGRAKVRVLIYHSDFTQHESNLRAWAKKVNRKSGSSMIDETFSALRGWTVWRRVLQEEDYPESAAVDEGEFDKRTAKLAAKRVLALVDQFRSLIEK